MTQHQQPWRPSLGAWVQDGATHFRVWAPAATSVMVEVDAGGGSTEHAAHRDSEGYHTLVLPGIGAGARYHYRLDGAGRFPDPASRFQPEGVHGPSEVVDPTHAWRDDAWPGLDRDHVVLYELHIGTFTPEGTFDAAARMLPHLADLGVTAVQVMPVADFAGDRNWGYDGVALYAPSRAYGRPEDLRAFVDAAHAAGIGVVLDVVYNHFGPSGAYHSQFTPRYFTEAHQTPWGAAINLDGPDSQHVRGFFFEHAFHWLHEYHVDGFRLDAVATLIDAGDPHYLAEYRDRTAAGRRTGQPPPFLLAEDSRNLAMVVQPRVAGGYGFDATYADDFHHEVRVLLTGAREGYYQDYDGSTTAIATSIEEGWTYTGQHSAFYDAPRGTDPTGLPLPRFMHCLQNHDQVGNRAFGDRLYHEMPREAYRAALALLMCSAVTPLLFMGDEWTTSSPFQYFTDHDDELGRLVVEGRRNEFRGWAAFRDPSLRERIPDPQSEDTFARSHLDWSERDREPYASMLRYHREWLRLRRDEPALRFGETSRQRAAALDDATVAVRREQDGAPPMLLVARLRNAGVVGQHASDILDPPAGMLWRPVLTSEDAAFAIDALPVEVDEEGADLWCHFRRPGAVLFRAVEADAAA
ncbi:MAG: malto-oligosyltrehalose trehalohydrolase [Dehalococcoidia bacterium]